MLKDEQGFKAPAKTRTHICSLPGLASPVSYPAVGFPKTSAGVLWGTSWASDPPPHLGLLGYSIREPARDLCRASKTTA